MCQFKKQMTSWQNVRTSTNSVPDARDHRPQKVGFFSKAYINQYVVTVPSGLRTRGAASFWPSANCVSWRKPRGVASSGWSWNITNLNNAVLIRIFLKIGIDLYIFWSPKKNGEWTWPPSQHTCDEQNIHDPMSAESYVEEANSLVFGFQHRRFQWEWYNFLTFWLIFCCGKCRYI